MIGYFNIVLSTKRVQRHLPNMPRFDTVMVPPWNSCGWSLPSRALAANSLIDLLISINPLRSAWDTIGVIKPLSVATATEHSTESYLWFEGKKPFLVIICFGLKFVTFYSLSNEASVPCWISLWYFLWCQSCSLNNKVIEWQFHALFL